MILNNDINFRIKNKIEKRFLTASTILHHFSIVTYKVDFLKLKRLIPNEFELDTIEENNTKYGLVSAITFIDKDFHFQKIFPFLKFEFPQTNYRAYVVNKYTKEKCVWFFGTSLGSKFVFIPKYIWKMPWFYARYKFEILNDNSIIKNRISIAATNAGARLNLVINENEEISIKGFKNQYEAITTLTHPVTGYFDKGKNKLGKYKIWHPLMKIKKGICIDAYFEFFEKLGLLNKEQMKNPFSVLFSNEIQFFIDLPPKNVKQ